MEPMGNFSVRSRLRGMTIIIQRLSCSTPVTQSSLVRASGFGVYSKLKSLMPSRDDGAGPSHRDPRVLGGSWELLKSKFGPGCGNGTVKVSEDRGISFLVLFLKVEQLILKIFHYTLTAQGQHWSRPLAPETGKRTKSKETLVSPWGSPRKEDVGDV